MEFEVIAREIERWFLFRDARILDGCNGERIAQGYIKCDVDAGAYPRRAGVPSPKTAMALTGSTSCEAWTQEVAT